MGGTETKPNIILNQPINIKHDRILVDEIDRVNSF